MIRPQSNVEPTSKKLLHLVPATDRVASKRQPLAIHKGVGLFCKCSSYDGLIQWIEGEKHMKNKLILIASVAMLVCNSAHAIDEKYRKQLERSGCTQMSELQGCDIHKSKAENAKAGFGSEEPVNNKAESHPTPYAGQWVAKATSGATVATIRIDGKENVWVNGDKVKAQRSDGALVFKVGSILYTIQGDRRLKHEDSWMDVDAKTKGPIVAE
jgi:hypothetical protein